MTEPVFTTLDDGILTVTLNNPEVRNAFSQAMGSLLIRELRDAAAESAADIVAKLTGKQPKPDAAQAAVAALV